MDGKPLLRSIYWRFDLEGKTGALLHKGARLCGMGKAVFSCLNIIMGWRIFKDLGGDYRKTVNA